MKKTLLTTFTLITVVLASCGPSTPTATEIAAQEKAKQDSIALAKRIETLDDLGKRLLSCIKANDFSELTKYIITIDEYLELMKNIPGYDEQKKNAKKEDEEFFIKSTTDNLKSQLAYCKHNFDEIIKKGTERGILWKDAEFDKVSYETKKENNIEQSSLKLIFKYRGIDYTIYLKDCIKTNNGWRIGSYMGFETDENEIEQNKQLNNALNDLNKSKDKAALDSLNSQLDKALNDLNH